MAQRRMFSKSITNASQFLMMPQSSQNLYFHLGMNADDDGFCEHFTIMRMTDSKPDDLKILQAKNFISVFDDKVLVIVDWKENNYLRADRYTPSKYLAIYKEELARLSSGIPTVATGKDRLGKVRIGEDSKGKDTNTAETSSALIPLVIEKFIEINPACKSYYSNKTQRQACNDLIESYGFDEVINCISNVLPRTNGQSYFPTITTPVQLRDKWVSLKSSIAKKRGKTIEIIN